MRLGKTAIRAAILLLLSATLLSTTSALAATNHTVQVGPNGSETFDPPSLAITAGDTITFENDNNGGLMHNATSDDGGATFNNGAPTAGPWSFTTGPINAPIAYHCTLHGTAGPGSGQPGTGMAAAITITTPVHLQSFDVH